MIDIKLQDDQILLGVGKRKVARAGIIQRKKIGILESMPDFLAKEGMVSYMLYPEIVNVYKVGKIELIERVLESDAIPLVCLSMERSLSLNSRFNQQPFSPFITKSNLSKTGSIGNFDHNMQ